GTWHVPHFLTSTTQTEKPHTWALNQENVQKVIYGMCGVVNEGGTGGRARIPGVDVCGKTGSAQIASNEFAKSHRGVKDNAWFVGFAPRNKPEIVVAALFEGGEHGMLAAPIVRDVMKAYFDKKARLTLTQKTDASPASALTSAFASPGPSNMAATRAAEAAAETEASVVVSSEAA